MKFKGELFGVQLFEKRLKDFPVDIQKKAAVAIAEGTLNIHAEAVRSIQRHMSQGIKYGKHTASKPGFPPNSDTGRLAQSIEFDIDMDKATGLVGTNLEYGKHLEFGTRDIRPRPWLSRAYGKFWKKITDQLSKIMKEAVKNG